MGEPTPPCPYCECEDVTPHIVVDVMRSDPLFYSCNRCGVAFHNIEQRSSLHHSAEVSVFFHNRAGA